MERAIDGQAIMRAMAQRIDRMREAER